MKKTALLFTISTLCGLGIAVAAPQTADQPNATQTESSAVPRRADPQRRVQMLTKKLNLTADQQNQLMPIIAERQQQIRAIFQDNSLSREDRIAKIRAVRESSNAKIEALLTGQQKQAFESLQQQMREHSHGHRGPQNNQPGDGGSNL